MAMQRSPNYPQMDLALALEAVQPAYKAEGRNKMSRLTLASHLGYSSLNGRALAKIGAVRAYGLIDGREDEIRISPDAITCMEAPEDSKERAEAIHRCATKPPIFKELSSKYEGLPSEQNLRFALIQKGYAPDAAGKAAQNYLATMRLVAESGTAYDSNPAEDDVGQDMQTLDFDMAAPPRMPGAAGSREPQAAPVTVSGGEREWLRGPLSREVSYRLIVNGDMGPKQIGKLIKLLEAQKAVLDDDEEDFEGL